MLYAVVCSLLLLFTQKEFCHQQGHYIQNNNFRVQHRVWMDRDEGVMIDDVLIVDTNCVEF